jgi:hypothetical protein
MAGILLLMAVCDLETRLIEALSFLLRCSIGHISVVAGIGMAIAGSHDEELERLIRRAVPALFTASRPGVCNDEWLPRPDRAAAARPGFGPSPLLGT